MWHHVCVILYGCVCVCVSGGGGGGGVLKEIREGRTWVEFLEADE